MSNRIIHIPKAKPNATFQLLCIPHAGGSISSFYNWQSYLPNVELGLIAYPGRYHRLKDEPILDIDTMLRVLVDECEHVITKNFALFGHGVGALMAYGLAEKLIQLKIIPKCLFVSGIGAPTHYVNEKYELYSLSDDEFIQAIVKRYNAIPEKILNDPELMKMFMPLIRADLSLEEQLVKKYAVKTRAPLSCDVVAFGGLDDYLGATQDVLSTWKTLTTGKFNIKMFPGSHFYLHENEEVLCNKILNNIK